MTAAEFLKLPYARVVVPEADGSFTAEILEFPGCVASGDTAPAALKNLEEVAIDWIAATLEQGQEIPAPLDHANYSGKLVVRMPKGLHKRAARAAEREATSLNQFIVDCIAEQVGTRARQTVYVQPQRGFANPIFLLAFNQAFVGVGGFGSYAGSPVFAHIVGQPLASTATGHRVDLPMPSVGRA